MIDFLMIGSIVIGGMIVYVLITGIPSGTKGITDEYTSKSGVKRTAKKEREDYIV